MATVGVIHLVGLNCRPDQDEKFNRWYNESHVPELMKFSAVLRVTRYKVLRPDVPNPGYPPAKYPQYLVIYELPDQATFETYEASPQMAEAMRDLRENWSSNPFERVWRVQYRFLRTWGERKPYELINLIANQCRPDQEEKFDRWYDETHVPYLLKTNCINKATRFTALYPGKVYPGYPDVKYPRNMAIYEFPFVRSYDEYEKSPALAEALQEWNETWGKDPYEKRWCKQYQLIREWENKIS